MRLKNLGRLLILLVPLAVLLAACGASNAGSPEWAPTPGATAPPVALLLHPDDGAVSVLDTSARKVTGEIALPEGAGAIAIDQIAKTIAVAIPENIAIIDLASRTVTRKLPWTREVSALAFAGGGLYVIDPHVNTGRISAISLEDGHVLSELGIDGMGGAPVVSADGRRLFVPHHFYSGFVTVLDIEPLSRLARIKFEDGAKSPSLSTDERWLFVPNGMTTDGRVSIVDTATNHFVTDITLTGDPNDLAIAPDGRTAIVTVFGEGQLAILDLATRSVQRTIPVPEHPLDLVLSPDGATAFVTHNGANALSAVSLATGTVTPLELAKKATSIIRPNRTATVKVGAQ